MMIIYFAVSLSRGVKTPSLFSSTRTVPQSEQGHFSFSHQREKEWKDKYFCQKWRTLKKASCEKLNEDVLQNKYLKNKFEKSQIHAEFIYFSLSCKRIHSKPTIQSYAAQIQFKSEYKGELIFKNFHKLAPTSPQ